MCYCPACENIVSNPKLYTVVLYYIVLYCYSFYSEYIQNISYEFKNYVIFPKLFFIHAIRWVAISRISCIMQCQTITEQSPYVTSGMQFLSIQWKIRVTSGGLDSIQMPGKNNWTLCDLNYVICLMR